MAVPRPSIVPGSIMLTPSTAAASPPSSSLSAVTAATSTPKVPWAAVPRRRRSPRVRHHRRNPEHQHRRIRQPPRRHCRTNSLRRIVVVSDRTHLFRIHQICAANGLDVLTSPRPRVQIEGSTGETERIEHEILSYTLWRLHLD